MGGNFPCVPGFSRGPGSCPRTRGAHRVRARRWLGLHLPAPFDARGAPAAQGVAPPPRCPRRRGRRAPRGSADPVPRRPLSERPRSRQPRCRRRHVTSKAATTPRPASRSGHGVASVASEPAARRPRVPPSRGRPGRHCAHRAVEGLLARGLRRRIRRPRVRQDAPRAQHDRVRADLRRQRRRQRGPLVRPPRHRRGGRRRRRGRPGAARSTRTPASMSTATPAGSENGSATPRYSRGPSS